MEPGETAVHAAKRELREETGLLAEVRSGVEGTEYAYALAEEPAERRAQYDPSVVAVRVECFRVEAPCDWEPMLNCEHDDHRWCSPAEAFDALRWPETAGALQRMLAEAETLDPNDVQLTLIEEIGTLLEQSRIRFWLRGGWALDFHLGRLTRQHADIDLVTWLRHRERIRRLLTSRGFAEVAGYPDPQLVLEKRGEEASFLFIARRDGQIVVPGYEAWPFRPGAFPNRRRSLRGVSARVVSAEELLYEKLHHEEWSGRPLRPKDHESIELLRALTGSS